MKLDSILDIMRKAQKRHPAFAQRLVEAEALGRWKFAVGDMIAKHAHAIRVQNSILWVEVGHPIWRAELMYRKQQILDNLNGKTPCAGHKKGLSEPEETIIDILFLDQRR
jgi:predicted nucleic acid-binding Zn ribbon protein